LTLITMSGIDNSGKSTQIASLTRCLQERGKSPIVLWSRGGYTGGFGALKALLRRLRPGLLPPPGQTKEREAALRRGRVRRLWLALALLDLIRVYGVNIRWWRLRGRTVICDRYLWDTLIDLRLSFPTENVERWRLWHWLVRLSPQPDVSFLLMIPVEESLLRSQEKQEPFPEPEEKRRQRYAQYQQLQQEGLWSVVVDATRPAAQVWAEIQAALRARNLDVRTGMA
jgi:thymidylate kinase